MSLIVDALKRAQEGAARHLPPFAAHSGGHPLPGVGTSPGRRIGMFAAAVVAFAVVAGSGLWFFARSPGRNASNPSPPSVLVVQPVSSPERSAPAGAQHGPGHGSEDGTSIPEVRAALTEADPPAPHAAPRATSALRRPRAGRRTTAAAAPVAPLPPSAARNANVGSAPPPVVEVHTDGVKQAAEALAAGITDHDQGDPDKAIEQYRRGIRLNPRDAALFNNLGVALKDRARLDEAADAFQRALAIDPKYDKALNNLGVIWYQKGRYEEAVDCFQRAIRANPAHVEAYVNLGIIYLPANRWDEALGAFQQALHYDPRSLEAYYNLGILWERRGDPDKALDAYRRFLALAGREHAALALRVNDHIRALERVP